MHPDSAGRPQDAVVFDPARPSELRSSEVRVCRLEFKNKRIRIRGQILWCIVLKQLSKVVKKDGTNTLYLCVYVSVAAGLEPREWRKRGVTVAVGYRC